MGNFAGILESDAIPSGLFVIVYADHFSLLLPLFSAGVLLRFRLLTFLSKQVYCTLLVKLMMEVIYENLVSFLLVSIMACFPYLFDFFRSHNLKLFHMTKCCV